MLENGYITREQFEDQRDQLLAASHAYISNTPIQPTMPIEVGAYRLLGLIGEGGMGMVYRGRHRSATMAKRQGGDVAVKVMHPQYSRSPEYRDRFEREAALGLKLDHANIVSVYDLVVDGGNLALVLEHVDGRPLSELIGEKAGPISWNRAWPLFGRLLEAAGYAHEQGVVHRDLKPENVLVTADGEPHVIDFGIAKDVDGAGTRTGTGMGTVEYMAPEQYTDSRAVDRRADIYSLGMTLYEMLAGRLPWDADAPQFEILEQKARKTLTSPSVFCPDIPREVVAALSPSLSAYPDGRPATTASFARALVAASPLSADRHHTDVGTRRHGADGHPERVNIDVPRRDETELKRDKNEQKLADETSRLLSGLPSWQVAAQPVRSGSTVRGYRLMSIEPGEFWMGSPEGEKGRGWDEKRLQVRITRRFLIGATPVTQALWASVEKINPSHNKGGNHPVECVSWFDAVSFCNKLSVLEGLRPVYDLKVKHEGWWVFKKRLRGVRWHGEANGYRLPTEAEWEYAARAGESHVYAGSDNVDHVAWYDANSRFRSQVVGQKQSNALGLFDMSGNVWEWVWDGYEIHPSGKPTVPDGSSKDSRRVYRGGSWFSDPARVRIANRGKGAPIARRSSLGFRVARSMP